MHIETVVIIVLFQLGCLVAAPPPKDSMYTVILKKCPYLENRVPNFSKQQLLQKCQYEDEIPNVKDITIVNVQDLLCSIYFKSITSYCSVIDEKDYTSENFIPITNYTTAEICSNRSVFPPNIGEVTNKVQEECLNVCTDYSSQYANLLCSLAYSFINSTITLNSTKKLTNIHPVLISQGVNKEQITFDQLNQNGGAIRLPAELQAERIEVGTVVEKTKVGQELQEEKTHEEVKEQKAPENINGEVASANANTNALNSPDGKVSSVEHVNPSVKKIVSAAVIQPDTKVGQVESNNLDETEVNGPHPEPLKPGHDPETKQDSKGTEDKSVSNKPVTSPKQSEKGIAFDQDGMDGNVDDAADNNVIDEEQADDAPLETDPEVQNGEVEIVEVKNKKPDTTDENPVNSTSEMEAGDSYFFSYFMVICILFIIGYVGYHNKQKVLALVLEGRRGKRQYRSRRPNSANYHKLDTNLEEAISSSCNKTATNVIY